VRVHLTECPGKAGVSSAECIHGYCRHFVKAGSGASDRTVRSVRMGFMVVTVVFQSSPVIGPSR